MPRREALTFGEDAFVSEEYARAEPERLWRKVWQHACREEDIPNVGDYVSYDICDDTIIVVRSAPGEISAFYNVCAHRGRRLVNGCGHTTRFHCKYHAWQYNLKGENIRVLDKEDWDGCLSQERLNLPHVKVDTWGGWVWINMDPDCKPLREYLEPAATLIAPYAVERMRYRWRKWCYFDCNWKVALEAFIEAYHVEGTHPQLTKFGDFYMWSKAQGLHGNNGFNERDPEKKKLADSNTINRPGKGNDARVSIAKLQAETWETVNARTTKTLVDAAARLVDELPEGTPAGEVMKHWLEAARRDDEARGVTWPTIATDEMVAAGSSWHIFPNMSLGLSQTNFLVYRARPYGTNPRKCIFEAAVLELFPEGQEPKTEWVYADPTNVEEWRSVLMQDFDNMIEVQRGMQSRGFRGNLPNPKQENTVSNFHRNLAKYMGVGNPEPLQ